MVTDGKGHEYFRTKTKGTVRFKAGGYPGLQSVTLLNKSGKTVAVSSFKMEAMTSIDDGGRFGELFRLLHDGMIVYSPSGYRRDYLERKVVQIFCQLGP